MYDQAIKYHSKYYRAYISKGNKLLHTTGYSLINLKRFDEADILFTKPIEMQNFK